MQLIALAAAAVNCYSTLRQFAQLATAHEVTTKPAPRQHLTEVAERHSLLQHFVVVPHDSSTCNLMLYAC